LPTIIGFAENQLSPGQYCLSLHLP